MLILYICYYHNHCCVILFLTHIRWFHTSIWYYHNFCRVIRFWLTLDDAIHPYATIINIGHRVILFWLTLDDSIHPYATIINIGHRIILFWLTLDDSIQSYDTIINIGHRVILLLTHIRWITRCPMFMIVAYGCMIHMPLS